MSIINSIQSAIVPVHREGWRFIAIFAAVTLLLFWLNLGPLGWIGVIATLWCVYFFRDPERVTPLRTGLVISPADGQVSSIEQVVPPPELDCAQAEGRGRMVIANTSSNLRVSEAAVVGIFMGSP